MATGSRASAVPKTSLSDEALVVEIRTALSESPFLGEGHRKVRARLAAKADLGEAGCQVITVLVHSGLTSLGCSGSGALVQNLNGA